MGYRRRFENGQGAMLFIAVVVLLGLIVGSASLSQQSKINAERNVYTKTALQTHYVAMAGIQEAIGSRMMPRSNYLAFNPINVDTDPGDPEAILPNSGVVFQNPTLAAPNNTLVGYYRYIIVGGDPARQGNGNYYPRTTNDANGVPWLVSGTHPASSLFFIVSNGVSCVSDNGNFTGVGMTGTNAAFSGDPRRTAQDLGFPTFEPVAASGGFPCRNGFTPEELTLVTAVRAAYDQDDGTTGAVIETLDTMKVVDQRVYKDHNNVRLVGAGAFVPGVGWVNNGGTFDFDTAYAASGAANHAATLRKVVFYDYADNTIFAESNGGAMTYYAPLPAPGNCVPRNAAIRVYFDGPVDFRALIPGDTVNCTTTPNLCNLRIWPGPVGIGTPVTNFTYLPGVPSFTNYVLWPQYGGSFTGAAGNYTLEVSNNIFGFNGAPRPGGSQTVSFQVCN